jgi:ubiquinone/menaquinone biosynthesis C-methylase UbiE
MSTKLYMQTSKTLSRQYYSNFFDDTANKGFNGFLFNFTHKMLEMIPRPAAASHYLPSPFSNNKKSKYAYCVLEVGGGSGQHIKFVKYFSEYVLTDLNPSLLPKNNRDSKLAKILYKKADVQNLPFKKESFDRVIATCLLHHLTDVEKALLEIYRCVKIGGLVSIYLSCDPGILNRLLRRLLIIPRARKLGFRDYEIFIAREHRNHFQSIESMIKQVFKDQNIQQTYQPFRIKSWNLNTFCIFQIQIIAK